MKANKLMYLIRCECCFAMVLACVTTDICLSQPETKGDTTDTEALGIGDFCKALAAKDDVRATSVGDSILKQMEKKYAGDAGFRAYKSKLNAAVFLAERMQQQLQRATNARIFTAADALFKGNGQAINGRSLSIAPAKHFYETSVGLFSKPVTIPDLQAEERSFFAQYYDLKLRVLTGAIAKTGQALAIAEPSFKGAHDYVLVLPLLHASDEKSINIDVLPRWMQRPEQLDTFSDSCLLHFGFPFHAMIVAKESAQIRNEAFSELAFYRSAAEKCGRLRPHIAVGCLHKAIDCIEDKDPEMTVSLQFDIVQQWLDSHNYALAAGKARKIFESYPDDKRSSRAVWLYYYSLSRSNDTDGILGDIDKALDDKRCEAYKAKLTYIKWWALRRKRDQTARVAAVEYELLEQYGNDPMVAPILLSRATDLLASQNYNDAYELLTQLVEKFPSTKAATQAKRMLAKLNSLKGAG